MDFWIIEKGEKRGPFPDYTLREMIRAKEVKATTKVWHEGAEGWSEAQDVGILAREFKGLGIVGQPEVVIPPPLPEKVDWRIMWRRLGARWFDASLSILLAVAVMRMAGFSFKLEPDDTVSVWLLLVQFCPAMILEGILVHCFARTPGKWLMNLHLETREGGRLRLGQSMIRSTRVWVLGLGMGMGILAIVGHGIALWMIQKGGAPLWDLMTGFQVKGRVLAPLRLVFFFIALIVVWGGVVGIVWPDIAPGFEEAMKKAAEQSLK